MLEKKSLSLLSEALDTLEAGFEDLPAFETDTDLPGIRRVLLQAAERMRDNYPYPHPLYAGHMNKPAHPLARLAYTMAMWINPNNHAYEGGRASSMMEKEAVADIARLYGWQDGYIGHLSTSGTIANMEALWAAGKVHPGKKIVASAQAHFTHARISDVLQLPFQSVPADVNAQMEIAALEEILQSGKVGTVVATLGTTGVGAIDPLHRILELRDKYHFRVHVDAAYGGYFLLADNLGENARQAFHALHKVDSIVVDPHKHGLQPYGCGCILFRDSSVSSIFQYDSPYTFFSSANPDMHMGKISLECSRAGASAVALWATLQLLPMEKGGKFAEELSKSRAAALRLYRHLLEDEGYLTLMEPELDILVWVPNRQKISEISAASAQYYKKAAERNLHLALITLPASVMAHHQPSVECDEATVQCLRSCLLKPEHGDWLPKIRKILYSLH